MWTRLVRCLVVVLAALFALLARPVPEPATAGAPPPPVLPGPGAPAACGVLNVVASPNLGDPDTNHLSGVAAVSTSDVWAVGSYNTIETTNTLIEHWDGRHWAIIPSPDPYTLLNVLDGITAVSAGDIWAVGSFDTGGASHTLVEHWDGVQWMVVPSPGTGSGFTGLSAVTAIAADDVWAVGRVEAQPLIEHWDGRTWSVVTVPLPAGRGELHGVAAVAAGDIWAVGWSGSATQRDPLLEHWDGHAWSLVPVSLPVADAELNGIVAANGRDIWAVGDYHAESGDLVTLTIHWDGTHWSFVPGPTPATRGVLSGVALSAPDDIWAVGLPDLLEHWNGRQWDVARDPAPDPDTTFAAVASALTNGVWAVGWSPGLARQDLTLIEYWDGRAWAGVPSPNITRDANQFNDIASISARDAWAVGAYGPDTSFGPPLIAHWDGRSWQEVPGPNLGTALVQLKGVAARAGDDVWAVGSAGRHALTEHWDGNAWRVVPGADGSDARATLNGIAIVTATDAWAVGNAQDPATLRTRTLIEHWDGLAWHLVPSPNVGAGDNYLSGVAVLGPGDVWAAGWSGDGGVIRTLLEHWNGSAWAVVPSPSPGTGDNVLSGIAAGSGGALWAVGSTSNAQARLTLVEHWDGTRWGVVPSLNPSTADSHLQAVAVVAPGDVWAVGAYLDPERTSAPLVEHWTGSGWQLMPTAPLVADSHDFSGVAARAGGDVWAVGSANYGGIGLTLAAHYGGACLPPPCPITFSDVPPSAYYYLPVTALACRGVLSGYADGTFRPYADTTRGQLAKIVVLGFGLPLAVPAHGAYTFVDVPPRSPFFTYVETAAAHGIVGGYPCGGPGEPCTHASRRYFRPNAAVTRGQLAKMVVAAARWPLLSPAQGTFADVAPASAFYPFVETAACRDILSGYDCGAPGDPCDPQGRPYFRPAHTATRGQIAKIVYGALTGPASCGAGGAAR